MATRKLPLAPADRRARAARCPPLPATRLPCPTHARVRRHLLRCRRFPIFIRSDVERVAKEKLGSEYEVKQARKVGAGTGNRRGGAPVPVSLSHPSPHLHTEPTDPPQALRNVNTQLASLQAQAATLEAQKATLEAQLAGLGASPEEPPKPRTAAKKGGRSKQPAAKRARKSAGGDSDDDWRP